MMKLIFFALAASFVGAAHAETLSYACKIDGQSDILKIDEVRNELSWHERRTRPSN